MAAIYGIAIGVILGWLGGGQLQGLRGLRLRLTWIVPPAALLQLFVIKDPFQVLQDPAVAGPLLVASYLLLVLFLLRNVQVSGLAVAALGLCLNLVVMVANGGLMPVSPESQRAAGHSPDREIVVGARTTAGKGIVLPADQTRLAFLSDTIVISPLPRPVIVSVGDLVTLAGVAYALQAAMRRRFGPRVEQSTIPTTDSYPV